MKKYIIILLFVFTLILVGCGSKDNSEEKLSKIIGSISIDGEIDDDFYLPAQLINTDEYEITWMSSNEEAIKISKEKDTSHGIAAYKVDVIKSNVDVDVDLTATVTLKNGKSQSKVFNTIVSKKDINDYVEKVNIPLQIEDTLYLPAQVTEDNDHSIYWLSSDKDVITINNTKEEIDGLLYYTTNINPVGADFTVTLTMTLVVTGIDSINKDYEVVVLKGQDLNPDVIDLQIFALNDFHGAVVEEEGGLSKIGNYIMNEKAKKPDETLIISSGDMFQGSAISNMTQGAVMVESMNVIGFDAMAIGNHEFDWGVGVIEKLNNKQTEVKSEFPIICANIYEKATDKPVSWCEPYTIVERSGIKIGIIGVIGSSLEDSIATAMVAPYEFKDPTPIIKEYVKELRTEKNCEIVILSVHDNTNNLNQSYANFSGEYQIDAILNGHTHSTYAGETMGSDGYLMPYIQSGSSGSSIGKVTLSYNKVTKQLVECSAENIKVTSNISKPNPILDEIINKYNEEVSKVSERVIGVAGEGIDRTTAARWAANVVRDRSGCQIGFTNGGGIRSGAFPIKKDQEITVGLMWTMMPFDNFVKTCVMTTEQIIKAYQGNDVVHSDNVNLKNGVLYIDGIECEPGQTFTVAANDYIFDKPNFPFLSGTNQGTTGKLVRDYLIEAVEEACKDGNKWVI